MRSFYRLILLTLILCVMVSCGAETPTSNSGSTQGLPSKFLKLAANYQEGLSVSVEVFDSNQQSLGQKDLAIDWVQQKVYTPDGGQEYKLTLGSRYSFLVLFSFQAPGLPKLPIGFVLKTEDITEEFPSITWSSEEIILSPPSAQLLADLSSSASVPAEIIPKLDDNQNGLSNLQEYIEGLNPADPDSTPQPPEVVGTVASDGYVDSIEIELDFVDPSGVAVVEPTDPRCGYSVWEVTPVDETTKHLKASFNVHSLPSLIGPGELTLKIKATDFLAASKTYEYRVNYLKTNTKDPAKLGPEIVILKPTASTVVSGEIEAEAEACDEKAIKTLEITNSGVDLGDQEGSEALYQGLINTEALGDGENRMLEFRAVATDGKVKVRSVPLTVTNDSPIRIHRPTPGTILQDEFELVAYVDTMQMPNVSFLSVESVTSSLVPDIPLEEQEEDANFSILKKASPGSAYAQAMNISFVSDELYFTVHLKAVSTDGKSVTRAVSFSVKNAPRIELKLRNNNDESFYPALFPGLTFLDWEVTNRGGIEDEIILNGQPQKDLNGAPKDPWLTVGTIPLVLQDINQYPDLYYQLKAKHVFDDGQGNKTGYNAQKEIEVTPVYITGLGSGDLDFETEDGIVDPSTDFISLDSYPTPPAIRWKALFESNAETIEIKGMGSKIPLNVLKPQTDHEVVVQILNSSGNGVISESFPLSFVTSDFRLRGWWRLWKGKNNYVGYTIFNDGSPNINEASFYSKQWVKAPLTGVLFDAGIYDHISPNSGDLHGTSGELTLGVLLYIENAEVTVDNLVTKAGEYALGFDPIHGYKLQLQLDQKCDDILNTLVSSNIPVTSGIHYLVVTYSAVNKQVIFYLDGKKTIIPMSGGQLQNLCESPLVFNGIKPFNNNPMVSDDFKGILGELTIYNRTLSEAEVLQSCERVGVCKP